MSAIASIPGVLNPQSQLLNCQALRKRLLAASVSEQEAIAAGFRSISNSWAVRRFDQCQELDQMMKGLGSVEIKLVLKNGRISIWRKR